MLQQQATDYENDLDDFRLYKDKHISMGEIVLIHLYAYRVC